MRGRASLECSLPQQEVWENNPVRSGTPPSCPPAGGQRNKLSRTGIPGSRRNPPLSWYEPLLFQRPAPRPPTLSDPFPRPGTLSSTSLLLPIPTAYSPRAGPGPTPTAPTPHPRGSLPPPLKLTSGCSPSSAFTIHPPPHPPAPDCSRVLSLPRPGLRNPPSPPSPASLAHPAPSGYPFFLRQLPLPWASNPDSSGRQPVSPSPRTVGDLRTAQGNGRGGSTRLPAAAPQLQEAGRCLPLRGASAQFPLLDSEEKGRAAGPGPNSALTTKWISNGPILTTRRHHGRMYNLEEGKSLI